MNVLSGHPSPFQVLSYRVGDLSDLISPGQAFRRKYDSELWLLVGARAGVSGSKPGPALPPACLAVD